jgi:hypothetical protein
LLARNLVVGKSTKCKWTMHESQPEQLGSKRKNVASLVQLGHGTKGNGRQGKTVVKLLNYIVSKINHV